MKNTLVLVRTDSFDKAMVALADLTRYGGIKILGDPRIIQPAISDWAFEKIVGEKPRKKPKAHVVAQIDLPPARAIGRVRQIHPPAHVVVIPPESPAHEEIMRLWPTLEKLRGFHRPKVISKEEESEEVEE